MVVRVSEVLSLDTGLFKTQKETRRSSQSLGWEISLPKNTLRPGGAMPIAITPFIPLKYLYTSCQAKRSVCSACQSKILMPRGKTYIINTCFRAVDTSNLRLRKFRYLARLRTGLRFVVCENPPLVRYGTTAVCELAKCGPLQFQSILGSGYECKHGGTSDSSLFSGTHKYTEEAPSDCWRLRIHNGHHCVPFL